MKAVMIRLLKQPTTKIALVIPMLFQIIFCLVWIPGYHGAYQNVKNLKIAIVNEDPILGKEVMDQLQKSLPFTIKETESIKEATTWLESRNVQMIIHIPVYFTTQIQSPEPVAIEYTINESNPMMIKSLMQGVANSITARINKEAIYKGAQTFVSKTSLPEAQAQVMATAISERAVTKFVTMNPVSDLSEQMIPLMLVIASYVGAMLMALNLGQAADPLKKEIGYIKIYMAMSIMSIIAAIVISLVGVTLITIMGGQIEQGFLTLWGFQALFMIAFVLVAQLFVHLLGIGGMLINIIMFSMQLVSSGAMIPRELLPDFFRWISQFLPATYAVDGNMNILFGGTTSREDILSLLWMILVTIAIGMVTVTLKSMMKNQAKIKNSIEVGS